MIKDAIRLVPDIRNYLDDLHRVEMFNQSLGALDDPTRATLARLLKEQLHSPNLSALPPDQNPKRKRGASSAGLRVDRNHRLIAGATNVAGGRSLP